MAAFENTYITEGWQACLFSVYNITFEDAATAKLSIDEMHLRNAACTMTEAELLNVQRLYVTSRQTFKHVGA